MVLCFCKQYAYILWITIKTTRGWFYTNMHSHKSGRKSCVSSRITTGIQVRSTTMGDYICFNEPSTVFLFSMNLHLHGLVLKKSEWLLAESTRLTFDTKPNYFDTLFTRAWSLPHFSATSVFRQYQAFRDWLLNHIALKIRSTFNHSDINQLPSTLCSAQHCTISHESNQIHNHNQTKASQRTPPSHNQTKASQRTSSKSTTRGTSMRNRHPHSCSE